MEPNTYCDMNCVEQLSDRKTIVSESSLTRFTIKSSTMVCHHIVMCHDVCSLFSGEGNSVVYVGAQNNEHTNMVHHGLGAWPTVCLVQP